LYGVFTVLFFSGTIPGCNLFNNSMVDYSLDNMEIAKVTGFTVKTEYTMMDDSTVLIPPGAAKIGMTLSNPRNFSVRQELLGIPNGKNITAAQISPAEIEVHIEGAEEGDDYALTLAMQSPDGLRDFPAYPLRIKCVSFETALRDFTVDGEVPPAFDPVKNAFQVNVPNSSASVTLGGTTVHPGAVIEIYAGSDDSGAVLARAAHTAEITRDLAVGDNYFYVKITAPSSSVQGYAVTVYRAMDSEKAITAFYFTLGSKDYGAGTGFTFEDGSGSVSGTDITVTVPYGTDIRSLTPVVIHTGETISPAAGAAQDFSNPVTYTITATDGTTGAYTVTVNAAKIAALTAVTGDFTSPNGFTQTGGAVSGADITAAVTSVTGTDSLGTAVTLAAADYAADDLTGAAAGADTTATLRVPAAKTSTGADITENFTVYIKNDAKAITAFSITSPVSATGTIDDALKTITVPVPYGTAITGLSATASFSPGASISPDPATITDYSAGKTYTVTAEDGTTQDYTVTVSAEPGITIGGITVEGLAALTFSGVPVSSVAPNTSITIVISGGTVTSWHIEVSGASALPPYTTNTFTAPSNPGFYNVNVIATVGGVDYSGSFGLIVEY
jgi:hypothetical protein